jgi:hypothetical protein
MTPHQTATLILGLLTAVCSGIAAWYWFRSSKQEPEEVERTTASVDDNVPAHVGDAEAYIYAVHKAYSEASRLNKIASVWSALAAVAGAVTAIIAAIP